MLCIQLRSCGCVPLCTAASLGWVGFMVQEDESSGRSGIRRNQAPGSRREEGGGRGGGGGGGRDKGGGDSIWGGDARKMGLAETSPNPEKPNSGPQSYRLFLAGLSPPSRSRLPLSSDPSDPRPRALRPPYSRLTPKAGFILKEPIKLTPRSSGVPLWFSELRTRLLAIRMRVRSLASLGRLRDPRLLQDVGELP